MCWIGRLNVFSNDNNFLFLIHMAKCHFFDGLIFWYFYFLFLDESVLVLFELYDNISSCLILLVYKH